MYNSSSSASFSSLQDATFDLNVKSVKVDDLAPNMPVRTDPTTKKLVSSKIALSDIDESFSQDIQDVKDKTVFIQLPLSNTGTHFYNPTMITYLGPNTISGKFIIPKYKVTIRPVFPGTVPYFKALSRIDQTSRNVP